MRTKIITSLKKELLLVELLENGYYEEYCDGIEVRAFLTDEVLTLTNYTLLGKPDEIKEEDVAKFVHQSIHTNLFAHYVKDIPVNTYCYKTALDSFHSALESEIYWDVNPIPPFAKQGEEISVTYTKWNEAQEKTFDRNRALIFVKN